MDPERAGDRRRKALPRVHPLKRGLYFILHFEGFLESDGFVLVRKKRAISGNTTGAAKTMGEMIPTCTSIIRKAKKRRLFKIHREFLE